MATVVKDSGERALLPPFTDEHEQLRESIGRWVREEIVPNVDAWEEAREFPRELYNRAGELGFLGLKYPEELGGQGGDYVHDAVWAEELAAAGASGGVGAGLGAHTGIATPPVFRFGTPDQHERFLRPAIRGERIAALGITEPGAGSDVASIRTRAEKVEGGYVVNGSKTFITNGVRADFLVCAVKTTEEGGHGGISFLILERDMPGYEVVSKLEKMGWHSSDTGELSFTDVEVPEENLLGEENQGFYLIMANFAVGAPVDVARRGRRDEAPAGRDRRLRARAPGVRAADRTLPGDPPQGRRDGDARGGLPVTHLRGPPRLRRRRGRDPARLRWRSCSPSAPCSRSPTSASRSTAATATCASTGSSAPSATPASGPIGGGTDEVMKEILGKQLGL